MHTHYLKFAIAILTFVFSWGAIRLVHHSALKVVRSEAQGQVDSPNGPQIPAAVDKTVPESLDLSPYEIAVFVESHPEANLKELWRRLGIQGLNFAKNWRGNSDPETFMEDCGHCTAETFAYDLDEEPGAEVLLRIADGPSENCRYLVFKDTDNAWKLLGHIDHDFGRYRMPHHTIILSKGRTWLAIQQQGQSGSGVALYFDRLFLVNRHALQEVMSFTSEGHQSSSSSPGRAFSGRVLNCELTNGLARIEIEFTVSYLNEWSSGPQPAVLFTKRRKALFVGKPGRKALAFDAPHSTLSQRELDAVCNIDSLSNEDFLKYNFAELSHIATGTNSQPRKWLEHLLETCDRTADKRRLNLLLARG